MRRGEHERARVQDWEYHDLDDEPAADDPGPLRRVIGLEHERSRHRGQREVERQIDEDRHEQRAPVHGADLTLPPSACKAGWEDAV